MMINRILKYYKLALLFLVLCALPPLLKAESEIVISGACKQLNDASAILADKQKTTIKEVLIFGMYRAMTNGQVTVYNQALLAADYKALLIPNEVKKPETYFMKKMMVNCEQVKSKPRQFLNLVIRNILKELKKNYKEKSLKVNFKTMFSFPEKQSLFSSEYIVVGFGNDLCSDFKKNIQEKPFFYNFHRAWILGYLVPLIMADELGPEQSVLMADEVYEKTSEGCDSEPDKMFAEVLFEVMGKRFNKPDEKD